MSDKQNNGFDKQHREGAPRSLMWERLEATFAAPVEALALRTVARLKRIARRSATSVNGHASNIPREIDAFVLDVAVRRRRLLLHLARRQGLDDPATLRDVEVMRPLIVEDYRKAFTGQ